MQSLFYRNAYFQCILYLICEVSGVLSIEETTVIPSELQDILKNTNGSEVKDILNKTRRIVHPTEVHLEKPYMVYLKLPTFNPKYKDYRRWLCGGVIISEEYILTSAACIEDARHFYVVAGTYRHNDEDDKYNNPCIKYGAKKAIWKCVPRNYVFDGHENDNIRWMNNDIAVVKMEDEFDFHHKIKGCDYAPKPISYNNKSSEFEAPGVIGTIAGWGSVEKYYSEGSQTMNSNTLLTTQVRIINKNRCKRRWGVRYHNIIDNYMICTKDLVQDLSEICSEKYVDCHDVTYSQESSETRRVIKPEFLSLHSAYHNNTRRTDSGGFCENDHGGPLVYGDGPNKIVIGIISACLVKERDNKCYGPFLYTSVYKNRILITCAIYKHLVPECNKLYRSSITHTETVMSWADHPDGPAKNEIAAQRRKEGNEGKSNHTSSVNRTATDKIHQHPGIIFRTNEEKPENLTTKNITSI